MIDLDAPEFQLGRRLYDAQVLLADAEQGPVDIERVRELGRHYCELVHVVGELRAEHRQLQREVKQTLTLMQLAADFGNSMTK